MSEWWSAVEAIATVIGILVTGAGVIVGGLALSTWKHQDRCQKIDRLLESYISCLSAGHAWQWKRGVGESRGAIDETTIEFRKWLKALMDYHLAFLLASPYLGKCRCKVNELNFSKGKLENAVINAGISLKQQNTSSDFLAQMKILHDEGVKEILKYRSAKFVH